eukprot:14206_1
MAEPKKDDSKKDEPNKDEQNEEKDAMLWSEFRANFKAKLSVVGYGQIFGGIQGTASTVQHTGPITSITIWSNSGDKGRVNAIQFDDNIDVCGSMAHSEFGTPNISSSCYINNIKKYGKSAHFFKVTIQPYSVNNVFGIGYIKFEAKTIQDGHVKIETVEGGVLRDSMYFESPVGIFGPNDIPALAGARGRFGSTINQLQFYWRIYSISRE